jgi:hypothetical protein
MTVPVVNVRVVRMAVCQRGMLAGMRVRFTTAPGEVVGMLVMLAVRVAMRKKITTGHANS